MPRPSASEPRGTTRSATALARRRGPGRNSPAPSNTSPLESLTGRVPGPPLALAIPENEPERHGGKPVRNARDIPVTRQHGLPTRFAATLVGRLTGTAR